MVDSEVNIKVGIDVSQAKTGLTQLKDELSAIASTKPKTNLTFLESITTALNSIKNTLDKLKAAFTQGFSVMAKSTTDANTGIKTVNISLDNTSKSAEKVAKSAEKMGSTLENAGKSAESSTMTAEERLAKFEYKIKQMIATISRLDEQELRFAKTPFGIDDQFYAINRQLMAMKNNINGGRDSAKMLIQSFRMLGDGKELNKIAGSLTLVEERAKQADLVINRLATSNVSLSEVGLAPKVLGDWAKINAEALKSEKTWTQLKNKLMSLNEVEFSGVYNSTQLLNYAIKNGLIPDLIKANEELTQMYHKKQTAQRVGLMNQNDLTTLNYLPRSIRAISEAYDHGKISTKEFVVQVQEAVNALNSTSYTRFVHSLDSYDNKLRTVNVQLERLQELARLGGVNNIAVANVGVKPIPEVKKIINDLMTGKKSLSLIRQELLELNNTRFNRISTNLENINRDLIAGKENTEMFMNGWSQMATSAAEKFAVFSKEVSSGMKLIDAAAKGTNNTLNQFNKSYESMLAKQYKANAGANGMSAYAQSNYAYKPTKINAPDYTAINRANQALKSQGATAGNVAGIMSQYSRQIELANRRNKTTASTTNKASTSITRAGRAASSTKRQVNALDRASGMLRRTISGLVVIFGWNLVMDLIEVGKNSMDAANQIKMMGQTMGWTNSQVSSFTGRMRELQTIYPKIDMSATAKSVMEMAKTYKLTNAEANRLIKTSAVFTSAMAKEGRTTEDANLALKDYLDGGSGWTRRMSEIGATKERLKDTGKWSGDENDVMGKINALDVLMQQKGYDELAKNIYTLDDAFNAFKYTLGSVLGEMAEGLTPTIIAMTKSVLSAIQGVRGFVQAFQGSFIGNEALQIIAVAGAFSGLAMVILKVIGTLWGLIQAKTLLTTLTNPIGVIVIAVSALAIAFYELGKSVGWWHDFNSMMEALGNNITTLQGKITLIGTTIGTIAGIALAKHFLSDSNIIVRGIDKVIDSIKKYISALAAKKVAEEADAASTAGKKSVEAAGEAGAAGAGAAAAGKVASEGEKVSAVSRVFGALGVEYSADAGFMAMFNAGATAIGSMLGAAIPIILGLTAIVGLVIAAVAALAAECILLLKGLQLLIKGMDFGSVDLSPAVDSLKQLNAALWEMVVAMGQMTMIEALHLLAGGFLGEAYQLTLIATELAKLKKAIPMINSFSTTENISKEAVNKLKSIGEGMSALATATQSMGSTASSIHWAQWWQWIDGGQLGNLQRAHGKITAAVPIINSFADMPDINKNASEKLKKTGESMKNVSDAVNALGQVRSNIGWGRIWEWLDGDTISNLQAARGRIWKAAEVVASFKDMPAIPNGTGNKLQRFAWTLTDIINALKLLGQLPASTGNQYGNIESWTSEIKTVRGIIYGVSAELRTLGDISAIPEGTGQKLLRVTWVLNDVKTTITTITNVLSSFNYDGDYKSIIDNIRNICRTIRGVSIQLKDLSTIANIPEGTTLKLQRITWTLSYVRNTVSTIKQFSGLIIPPEASQNISNATGTIHKVAVPLHDLSTIAVIPDGVSVKLQRLGWVLMDVRSLVYKVKTANSGMAGLPDGTSFQQKLNRLRVLLNQIATFSRTISNTGANNGNASGITSMVRSVTTQVRACVNAVNSAIGSLRNAGYRLGSGLRNGVSRGVSNMAHPVWVQVNSMNSAMSSAQGKANQTGGVFRSLQSKVYTLTQGINNLANAINNLPSSKSITIGINTTHSNSGAGLPLFLGLAGYTDEILLGQNYTTIQNYNGGTASAGGGLFAGLGSRIKNSIHGAGVRLSGGFDRMSAFESLADTVIGNTSYQYYYNSKNGGDVGDSLRSGEFNCYDGSLVLMSLASLLGLDSEMRGTTVGGEGHAYTKIGGKIFDSTAMQLFGRHTAPRVNYSGTSTPVSSNSKDEKLNHIETTIVINGDVYGEKDLKTKIKEGAEEVLIDVMNPSKASGL